MNIKNREKYDDFETEDNYDFSDGVRGRFYKPKKIPITVRYNRFFELKKSTLSNSYQCLTQKRASKVANEGSVKQTFLIPHHHRTKSK